MTVSSHQRSAVHSILKSVFIEIQNKAIRPVLSGPVTYFIYDTMMALHRNDRVKNSNVGNGSEVHN